MARKDMEFDCGLTLGQAKDINQKDLKGKQFASYYSVRVYTIAISVVPPSTSFVNCS